MTIRNLDFMFKPASIALIGASDRVGSVGAVLTQNLLHSGFKGQIFLVNPKYEAIENVPVYRDLASLPLAPDLAVVATPPELLAELTAELGSRGTKAAVVVTASSYGCEGECRAKWHSEMLEAARPYLLRILGPNSMGIIAPGLGLNAGLGHVQPAAGNLAFAAQSGAVEAAVLDWAVSRNIGFSHFIGLGDMADVDFGDLLDYLANEPGTKAILLYMETVTNARKFMSAARAAARMKPVIVVKAGRYGESARAAEIHTGARAGRDEAYEAAFCRAGMLRVPDLQELFAAVETLGAAKPVQGDRLAVLTNGGGPGVLAVDALKDAGGRLAQLSPETMTRLDALLPPSWSQANPVDILDNAPPGRYGEALEILLEDKGLDGLLVLNAPSAVISSLEAAQRVVESMKKGATKARPQVVLTCWPGGPTDQEARRLFAQNRIPTYESPADGVRGFMHMVHYRRNQEMLMEIPPNIPESFTPDTKAAQAVIDQALLEDRSWLTAVESKSVLNTYGIPVVPTLFAATPEEAATLTTHLHPPVALKILSPDIQYKTEVCGVALHLDSPEMVRETARAMADEVRSARPDARIHGFTLQPMVHRMNAHELLLSVFEDSQFGPVIVFGHGTISADAIQDKAFALPPLNMHLAREVMSRTRIHRVLEGQGAVPAVNVEAVALTLVKISQLICDFASIAELEINPLLVDARSVIALDVRIRVAGAESPGVQRLAIRPYPKELEETLTLPDGGSLLIRPIRPEDEPGFHTLFAGLSPDDIRLRFLHPMKALPHSLAARLTQIDYDREMALVVTDTDAQVAAQETGTRRPQLYGSVRLSADPDIERAEFAILLRRDMTGVGLGPMLMRRIIEYARSRGIKEIYGEVLSENRAMLSLCKAFRFTCRRDPDEPGVMAVCLNLS